MDVVTMLVGATMAHLGFQATVTLVVYPAFAPVPLDDWPVVHAAHSRRIGPLVVVVYGALVLAGGATVVAGPSPWAWLSVAASGAAILVTALVAGPAHLRLSPDRPARLLARLVAADRVRLGLAVVAAASALVAAV